MAFSCCQAIGAHALTASVFSPLQNKAVFALSPVNIMKSQAAATDDTGEQGVCSCPICWQQGGQTAFGCGHVACEACALLVDSCPVCRAPVRQRLQLFL